jgi:hypothetical protein
MRNGFSRRNARWAAPLLATVVALTVSGTALAGGGVNGADFTTMNTSFDGTGHCLNGNGNVNCNIYNGKQYVWTNGGPDANKLLPDGYYFFAVLIPSGQPNPNDGGPGNLSDDYDTYQNRTFRVTNGEISSYSGSHIQDIDENDNNERKIRLYPYADTTNNGGVYIMATCFLGTTAGQFSYPVAPKTCKYDAFKVPIDDREPPVCPKPTFAFNRDGQWTATAVFQDPGGIDTIEVVSIKNAVASFDSSFFQGTTAPVTLTASKLVQSLPSQVVVYVRDVAGNQTQCDPVLTTVRSGRATQVFKNLSRHESRVVIRNNRRGVRTVVLSVNGRRYVARGLRAGERRLVRIGAALRPGRSNRVTVHALGRRGGSAMVTISN